jgi:hypothetical protein
MSLQAFHHMSSVRGERNAGLRFLARIDLRDFARIATVLCVPRKRKLRPTNNMGEIVTHFH